MIRRPPRSTLTHSFPTRRSSDLKSSPLAGRWQHDVLMEGVRVLAQRRFRPPAPSTALRAVPLPASGEDLDHATPTSSTPPSAMTPRTLAPSAARSEEHTSELQSLMLTYYAVFFLKNTKEQ